MKVLAGLYLLLLAVTAAPPPDSHPAAASSSSTGTAKQSEHIQQPTVPKAKPETQQASQHNATQTPTVKSDDHATSNMTIPVHCSKMLSSIESSGILQDCKVHDDCMGACCNLELLAHRMSYNFSVLPCEKPSVQIVFNITDLKGAVINKTYTSSESVTIPKGNMSYAGMYETESNVDIVLDKVLDTTHFRLDFGVHYRVLKNDQLKSLFTHTLIPMVSLPYAKDICIKPTGGDDKIFGVIPKEYVKDKTKLALVGTIVALAVVVLIGFIYFVIAKRRASGAFYRTYVSTDENRHLTKGNDGFEPLDDSDID